jgi:UPF0271 protein
MLKKAYLIDTAVLIYEVKLDNDAEIYVVEGVINEAKSLKAKLRKEIILAKAKIYKPSKESIKEAINISNKLGETKLTETDIEIIASAIELKRKYGSNLFVMTDDYEIQNVLKYLNINFKKLTTEGIKKVIKWSKFCKICKTKFDAKIKVCPNCNSELVKIKDEIYNS